VLTILDMADVPRWLSLEDDPRELLRPYPTENLDVSRWPRINRAGDQVARSLNSYNVRAEERVTASTPVAKNRYGFQTAM